MRGVIFLLGDEGRTDGQSAIELNETGYDSEELLQRFLAAYPNIMPGDQIDPDVPRRWLLVSREMGLPGEAEGSDRWSVDHLFLDQDGIPTIVEVKRSSDTRIRREVVGQMLDYAANGVVYWPVERLRADFEARVKALGEEPSEVLAEFLANSGRSETFWENVKTNLVAGRVRLLFVADTIPPALQRIIEFLNRQMETAEVLGIEIKQYVGAGQKALVPRVIGRLARPAPPSEGPEPWTEFEFFAKMESHGGPEWNTIATALRDWQMQHGSGLEYSTAKGGAMHALLVINGERHQVWGVGVGGRFTVPLRRLRNVPPFDDALFRREVFDRLAAVPGTDLTRYQPDGFPSISYEVLQRQESLQALFRVLEWLYDAARATRKLE